MKTINFNTGYAESPFAITTTGSTTKELHLKNVDQLYTDISHFSYKKKDGTLREAFGTLNKDIIGRFLGEMTKESTERTETPAEALFINYFDLTAKDKKGNIGDFRRYDIENLIAVF